MRKKPVPEPLRDELTVATGLIWGHLNAQQPEEAYELARGCLQLWPDNRALALMAAYAAVELAEPVDLAALRRHAGTDPARAADEEAWIALIARRAGAAY
ncbi:hypothetical protein [Pseudoduganella chitinolytica]|uniref:Uncharacterized protein n=1 Tax=Pseudoduganella chitinolytica TaxID=34070 RepID=A0ABY8B8G4_9BURK|nr:hypothetical protein [Pseudoduganella chitinolytica]WEF32221.1 hypothetical protein PX653_22815 [Pseudoduganella chitinolytica]